jgi:hypothetical protein
MRLIYAKRPLTLSTETEHAQFDDGSVSVEAGLMKMLTMMQAGRFKVFKRLNNWLRSFDFTIGRTGRFLRRATT